MPGFYPIIPHVFGEFAGDNAANTFVERNGFVAASEAGAVGDIPRIHDRRPGITYLNTSTGRFRIWSGTAWNDFANTTTPLSSVAELVAAATGGVNNFRYITGYSESGDGGAGHFYFDATEPKTSDDGGTILASTSVAGLNGCWKRIYSSEIPVVHPEWWGVDGTADDVEIQAAVIMVAALANGGVVQLFGKVYNLLEQIYMRSSVTLRGMGVEQTTLRTVYVDPDGGKRAVQLQASLGADDITIEELTIDGYRSVTPDTAFNQEGVKVYSDDTAGVRRCTLRNLCIKDCHFRGVYLLAFSDVWPAFRPMEVNLNNVIVTGCQIGFYSNPHPQNNADPILNVFGSEFSENDIHGMFIYATDNFCVDKTSCSGNLAGDGIAVLACEGFTISNCLCMENIGASLPDDGWGIKVSEEANDCLVMGNRCIDNDAGGIVVDLAEAGDPPCTLHDAQSSVIGNYCCSNSSYHGIYINNVRFATVSGNVCCNNGVVVIPAGTGGGIAVLGDYCIVVGNVVIGNQGYGVRLNQAVGCSHGKNIVQGNVYDSNVLGDFYDDQDGSNEIENITKTFTAVALYDFGINGGAQGDIDLAIVSNGMALPNNAVVVRAWYEIITPFTSDGGSTVAFGVDVDDAGGLKGATAFGDASYAAGFHDFLPDGTAVNFTTKTTDARAIILTIAGGADLTAGKVRVWCEYVVSE